MTRCTFGDTNVFFYFPKFDRNRGSHWMHFCLYTVFRMFPCLQINWQPFYLRQLLKFHPSDWPIGIYLQIEGQGTHHKMVSLQPMPGFPPPFVIETAKGKPNLCKAYWASCLFSWSVWQQARRRTYVEKRKWWPRSSTSIYRGRGTYF